MGLVHAQVPTGKITGKVTDDQGEPLSGVTVSATSPNQVGKTTATTDEWGVFRLFALTPGEYTLLFELPGFRPADRKDIAIGAEDTIEIDITMKSVFIEEQLTVIAQAPLIDVKSTTQGKTLTKELFQVLPRGRNFDSLMTTIPSVLAEPLLGGLSVDGASGAENMYYVDGTNTTNLVFGTSGQQVLFEFAEEIQVKASGYNAEFGGSLGGVVHVITRSGGNTFRGELTGYYYGTALEGTRRPLLDFDFDDPSKSQYYTYKEYVGRTREHTLELGFSLGGYIERDKLWFFGSFLPRYMDRQRTTDYAIQNLDIVKKYHRTENDWNWSLKLTAQPTPDLRIGVSMINNYSRYKGNNVAAATSNPETDYNVFGFSFPNFTLNSHVDWTLGNQSLISLRAGYWQTDVTRERAPLSSTPFYAFTCEQPYSYLPVTNTMFPEIPEELTHPPGWQNIPLESVMQNAEQLRTRINVNADFTYYFNLAGEHSFKAGIQYVHQRENVDNTAQQPIVFLAWDKELEAYGTNYGRGTYGWYAVRGNETSGPYGNLYDARSDRWAFYIQDSWTVSHRWTINFGLRAESEYLPSYSRDPATADIRKPVNFPLSRKIAPRFSLIYDVLGDSSFKIFAGYGIFHDVMKLYMAANALGGFKWKTAYYTLDDYDFTQIGAGGDYPGTLLWVHDFRPPVFDSIDPDMRPFTQREISVGLEKQVARDMSLSLRVVNKTVLWAIEDCGVFLPEIGEYYYYTNPGGNFIKEKYAISRQAGILPAATPDLTKAKRNYWAFNVSLDKRFSNRWLGGVSYTLSRLHGNYSGLVSSDEFGRNSPNGERFFDMWYLAFDKRLNPIDGPLPTDRPHVFKAYGSYALDGGLTLGAIVNAMSGTPVTEEWVLDSPGYFPFNRKNLGRTPFLWFVNVYAEQRIRIQGRNRLFFSLNIDNLFDTATALIIYPRRYNENLSPGYDTLLSGDWAPPEGITLHPLFQKELGFYPPISARLGIRFLF